MSRTLMVVGHPDLDSSYTNKVVVEALSEQVEDIQIRRLDERYPDFKIDVASEQAALLAADTIVLQFPFFWYSVPALLKHWIDEVFSFNFAYGPEGDKLKGKDFILSFTIGGPEEAYQPLGFNHFTIEQMLYPLQQTAYLAGMVYHKPVYTHRMIYIPGVYNTQEAVEKRARDHSERLLRRISGVQSRYQQAVEQFVGQWFEQMDYLPEVPDYFLKYLTEDFEMDMPEGLFKGKQGFTQWYEQARKFFKPGSQHQVEMLDVNRGEGSTFAVNLRVRVLGETLEGDSLNLLVNEHWRVQVAGDGTAKIQSYQVALA